MKSNTNLKALLVLFLSLAFLFSNSFALTYVVKAGDNPDKIAKKFKISVKELLKANKIKNPKRLMPGQKLIIPTKSSSKSVKKKKKKEKKLTKKKNLRNKVKQTVKIKRVCRVKYKVRSGDALVKIAKKFRVKVSDLKKWNNLKSNKLMIGQLICIKPINKKIVVKKEKVKSKVVKKEQVKRKRKKREARRGRIKRRIKYRRVVAYYRVRRGESLGVIAHKFHMSMKQLIRLNKGRLRKHRGRYIIYPGQKIKVIKKIRYIAEEEYIPPKNLKFGWPIDNGKIIRNFINTETERHVGLDIATNCGTKVKAAEDGKVIYAGDSIKTFGNLIIIRHPNRYNTVYGHIGKILVKEGEKVKKGEVIGTAGELNHKSCGIYFEIRKNTIPINPTSVLEKN